METIFINLFSSHVSQEKVVAKPDECFYVPCELNEFYPRNKLSILFLAKNEKALKEAVDKYGPTAISINAGDDFQHYDHGIFYG